MVKHLCQQCGQTKLDLGEPQLIPFKIGRYANTFQIEIPGCIVEGYKKEYKNAEEVIKQIDVIEGRMRYAERVASA